MDLYVYLCICVCVCLNACDPVREDFKESENEKLKMRMKMEYNIQWDEYGQSIRVLDWLKDIMHDYVVVVYLFVGVRISVKHKKGVKCCKGYVIESVLSILKVWQRKRKTKRPSFIQRYTWRIYSLRYLWKGLFYLKF